jgi:enoyl-CoA hydratase/carnithine racemase
MAGTIRVETPEPGIARVVFDHPERLNALSNAMWDSLRDIMAALDAEESLRCVILAGAGERAFGVGADISEFEQNRGDVAKARAYEAKTGRRGHPSRPRTTRRRHGHPTSPIPTAR